MINFVVVTRCVTSHNSGAYTERQYNATVRTSSLRCPSMVTRSSGKNRKGIEFVKHYRVHMLPIVGISASANGGLFASVSERRMGVQKVSTSPISVCVLHTQYTSKILTYLNLKRHDQHDQTRIHTKSLLLGASEKSSAGHPCRVCAHSFARYLAVAAVKCTNNVSSVRNQYLL